MINSLLQFLVATGYTGVFEILSPEHQHVEDLSHLNGYVNRQACTFIKSCIPTFICN